MVNSSKIKGRMKELNLTQADVALALKIAQPTANQKLNNVRPFDLDEAEKLSALLHIDPGEFDKYFFMGFVAYRNKKKVHKEDRNMDINANRIGRNIQKLRFMRGYKSYELSRAMGLSDGMVSTYECGTHPPSLHALLSLCKVLECTPGEILEGWDKP